MTGKGRKSNTKSGTKKSSSLNHEVDDLMDDEIDAFHKQRDVVPLDMDDDMGDSDDDDNELPVYGIEGDSDEEEDDDEDDDDDDDDEVSAKIKKQSRYIQGRMGGADDETHDDIEDDKDQRNLSVWGRNKEPYYKIDAKGQTSDGDQSEEEEEVEVLRLQEKNAKALSTKDFGLDDVSQDESEDEQSFVDILAKGKAVAKAYDREVQGVIETTHEVVPKDLGALSREEKMDIVYSSAPELVGLLSELNDALEQLENKVNPILFKIREGDGEKKNLLQYFEMKKQLLLSYCQAITFYLLLKSEGQQVRDHPVISRLVEIKNLVDRVKQLDENLPSEVDASLTEEHGSEAEVKLVDDDATLKSDGFPSNHNPSVVPSDRQHCVAAELVKVDSLRVDSSGKRKRQDSQLGSQSVEMLKVRAALEEKLKQKGVLGFTASKPDRTKKSSRPINGQLEALDDFDDEAEDIEGSHYKKNGENLNVSRSNKLSQLVAPRVKKPKVISGDDDLPKRDDIGERRRKHELKVLQGAGIESENDDDNEGVTLPRNGRSNDKVVNGDEDAETDSDIEFYKQVQQERSAKVAAKHGKVPRNTGVSSLPEATLSVDGKRNINREMEKNRGLTRHRNKEKKNPRKNYKIKHKKAVERRKGQVRDVKKPSGPYGGETSGINQAISRSIRLT